MTALAGPISTIALSPGRYQPYRPQPQSNPGGEWSAPAAHLARSTCPPTAPIPSRRGDTARRHAARTGDTHAARRARAPHLDVTLAPGLSCPCRGGRMVPAGSVRTGSVTGSSGSGSNSTSRRSVPISPMVCSPRRSGQSTPTTHSHASWSSPPCSTPAEHLSRASSGQLSRARGATASGKPCPVRVASNGQRRRVIPPPLHRCSQSAGVTAACPSRLRLTEATRSTSFTSGRKCRDRTRTLEVAPIISPLSLTSSWGRCCPRMGSLPAVLRLPRCCRTRRQTRSTGCSTDLTRCGTTTCCRRRP